VTGSVIIFSRSNDQIDNIGETAATAATFAHRMIDFDGNDQLPTVFVKKLDNGVLDFLVRDIVAAADEHSGMTCET
jgi:hypothetical protein